MAQPSFDPLRARELYDEGHSCRAIANELGVAPSTISRWASNDGLKFNRSQTALAVRAHTVDLAAARIELAQMMAVAAREGLEELDRPFLVYSFGGKDNTYEEHLLDHAPQDVRNLAQRTAGIAFDKLTRIVEHDNSGLDETVGMLDTLADGFRAVADQLRATTPDQDDDADE
jgi:predicted transcriptional regulator